MRILTVLFLCFVCSVSHAADRSDKIRELMELQGLVKMYDQMLQNGHEHSRVVANQTLEKVLTNLNPPDEFKNKLRQAATEYFESMQAPWTGQDIVEVWSKYYGAKFSDAELDQLLEYYRSPLGQKDVASARDAMGPFTAEFQARYKPIIDKATQQFTDRIQVIIKECNCQK